MPGCPQTASRTDETIRPPEVKQVFSTSLFGGKPLLKSKKCLGKVFHPSTLRVVARGVKCITRNPAMKSEWFFGGRGE